jgi:hypothetical protein
VPDTAVVGCWPAVNANVSSSGLDLEIKAEAKSGARCVLATHLARMLRAAERVRHGRHEVLFSANEFRLTTIRRLRRRETVRAKHERKSRRRNSFHRQRFAYEYHLGSKTTLQLVVVDERNRRLGSRAVRLLAQNTAPVWPCAICGEPAAVVFACCLGDEMKVRMLMKRLNELLDTPANAEKCHALLRLTADSEPLREALARRIVERVTAPAAKAEKALVRAAQACPIPEDRVP